MQTYLYLTLVPEALVFSMLPPAEFGRFLALGADRRMRGQAIFFEVDPEPLPDFLDLENLRARCKPHPDGRPQRSSYVSIYRVLETVPLAALRDLFLIVRDGGMLRLQRGANPPPAENKMHLYQELCPVTPRVVSRLAPADFASFITTPNQPISLPRIVFAELALRSLAKNPAHEQNDLPYRNMKQLRFCLTELQSRPDKMSKIVDREMQRDLPYWLIEGGIYAGDQTGIAFYPMPSEDELRRSHFGWFSSAQAVEVM